MGDLVGLADGLPVGDDDVGATLPVGDADGEAVGDPEVGAAVGDADGDADGPAVQLSAMHVLQSSVCER